MEEEQGPGLDPENMDQGLLYFHSYLNISA